MSAPLPDILSAARVIPVLEIDDARKAVPLARALVDGGLSVIEVTLRTPAALESVAAIRRALPDCTVGVGTILDERTLAAARESGAAFGVSPGTTPALRRAIAALDWPFLPGASTVSEVMTLREAGLTTQKLFPATALGGIDYLKALRSLTPDVAFCPTGGISAETAPGFLALENVVAVGGSWIAPRADIAQQAWDAITARATSVSSWIF